MLDNVTIVTVLYNDSREQFRDFLDSLSKIKKVKFELILVNNDQRIDWLKPEAEKLPRCTIIDRPRNIGFCAGSNLGLKKALTAGASHILLVNGDTLVRSDVLSKLLDYLYNNPNAGIVSPIILSEGDGNKIFYGGGVVNRYLGFTRQRHMNSKYRDGLIKSGKTDYTCGCCMLVKRSVLEKIGLLDEDYFMYFDDPDFSLRAQAAGFETHLLAEPLVRHIHSSNKLSGSAAYYYGRNPFILVRNNFAWYQKPTAYLGQFIIRLPRNIFRCQNPGTVKRYLFGMIDGIKGGQAA